MVFSRIEMREKAGALVIAKKPFLLIESPPCTSFSTWQHLNAARLGWTEQDIRRRRAEGVTFCCELYRMQLDGDRYFLHEHPAVAGSGLLRTVQGLMQAERVSRIIGDQC